MCVCGVVCDCFVNIFVIVCLYDRILKCRNVMVEMNVQDVNNYYVQNAMTTYNDSFLQLCNAACNNTF